jgi:putative ABC transport system permease protein
MHFVDPARVGGPRSKVVQFLTMRGLLLLDDVLRDLRYSIPSIRKDLRFTFVAVFALALGIGASTVVFSVFYNLMCNAVAARDAQRLVVPAVQNAETPEFANQLWISWADLKYLREHSQVFENVVGSHSGMARVQYGTRSCQFENGHVSLDPFLFYGVPPLLGRGMVATDGKPDAPPVFVMSFPRWKGQFGADPGIFGKSFVIEGDPATLVGVMPERFHGFGATQEIWTPVGEAHAASETEKRIHVNVLARVKRGISFAAASARTGSVDPPARRAAARQ